MKNIILKNGKILLKEDGGLPCHLPFSDEETDSLFPIGFTFVIPAGDKSGGGVERYSVREFKSDISVETSSDSEFLKGFEWRDVRSAWHSLGDKEWIAVAKGVELLNWDKEERYCRTCGKELEPHEGICKRCSGCGAEWFAPMTPAIMVLVEDERGRILLAHNVGFRGNFYSLIAGFVETGETLEECVMREVKEETGLDVENIRYVGSQSWPFPHQLMIGFRASLRGGKLEFQDGELSDGGFFDKANLPELPGMPSLARRMIEAWKNGE